MRENTVIEQLIKRLEDKLTAFDSIRDRQNCGVADLKYTIHDTSNDVRDALFYIKFLEDENKNLHWGLRSLDMGARKIETERWKARDELSEAKRELFNLKAEIEKNNKAKEPVKVK